MQDKAQIAFVLDLAGGLLSLGTAVMMGLFMVVFAGFAVDVPAQAMPFPFLLLLLGWLAVGGLVGGIVMLVAAAKARDPRQKPAARTLSFVGGGAALVGGNMLAGALGIVAGALLMDASGPGIYPPASK